MAGHTPLASSTVVLISACYAAGGSEVRRLFEELGHPLTDQKLFDVMERFDADGTVRADKDKQDCPDVSAD